MRLIDADVLREQIVEVRKDAGFYSPIYDGFLNAIDRSHTIEAEPVKHGRWENLTHNGGFACCSECHCCWEWGIINDCNVRYCPNCGSKMEVDDER